MEENTEAQKLTIDQNQNKTTQPSNQVQNTQNKQTTQPTQTQPKNQVTSIDDNEKARLQNQKTQIEAEIPYQIDPTYKSRLIDALKKKGLKRLKILFEPEFVDITKSEKEQLKMEDEYEKKLKK